MEARPPLEYPGRSLHEAPLRILLLCLTLGLASPALANSLPDALCRSPAVSKDPAASPFIEGSKCDEGVRVMIQEQVGNEFER